MRGQAPRCVPALMNGAMPGTKGPRNERGDGGEGISGDREELKRFFFILLLLSVSFF